MANDIGFPLWKWDKDSFFKWNQLSSGKVSTSKEKLYQLNAKQYKWWKDTQDEKCSPRVRGSQKTVLEEENC